MPDAAWTPTPTPPLRVEKRKWDGTASTVDTAHAVSLVDDAWAWVVPIGTRRERPGRGTVDVRDHHELWVAVPGEWWVLCGYVDAARSLSGYKVHASAPFEAPRRENEIIWVDLDLDFEVTGDRLALLDEDEFHAHAKTMSYPKDVVTGAWSGIATIASRYTNGEWPFDGSMQDWVADASR